MRYVHPSEEHKCEAVGKLENFKFAEARKLAERVRGHYSFRYNRDMTVMRNSYKLLKRMVTQPGFEPGTYCLGGSRSIHLSYWVTGPHPTIATFPRTDRKCASLEAGPGWRASMVV